MIYRAPERAVPARSRAITHELAALLVGMALVAALVLQVACAGTGGPTARWLCINNARLAALRPTAPPPSATPRLTRGGAILPVGGATPAVAGAPAAPSATAAAPSPFDAGRMGAFATPDPFGQDAGGAPSLAPTPQLPGDAGLGGGSPVNSRRATMTALAVAAYDAATARADRAADATPTSPTAEPTAATPLASETPGPGTPTVTSGPSPTGTATATTTGYPQP